MKIIDAHSHFINQNVINDGVRNCEFLEEFQDPSVESGVKFWLDAMDKNEVEKVIFIALSPGNKDFMKFVGSSDRFVGITTVDPTDEDAVKCIDRDVKAGCKGVKLYASTGGYDVADSRADRVYEYCERKGIPIIIHFGVSLGKVTNLMYGNPLCLSPVIMKFPNLKFIIAHFGAGYFREVLLLTYKNENVYFDTSGRNNWLDTSPFDWDLKDVFKKALKCVGSERILFGTDSYREDEGYRDDVLKEQMKIVKELAGKKGVEDIFYNNAKKVFGI